MWSSEPRESIAICKANVAALFLNHFKTLSVGPVPRIERGCSRALYRFSKEPARASHARARKKKKKTTVRFPYIEGLFRTSRYCHARLVRLQLARLQHDTSTTWFQTSNLFQSNRTVACERQTFLLAHRR